MITDTRQSKFSPKEKKKKTDRRTVNGLMHQLSLPNVCVLLRKKNHQLGAEWEDKSRLSIAPPPNQTATNIMSRLKQGVTISLNGQKQITKHRRWFKDELNFYFLFNRLVVLVDGTGLSQDARRQVFTSTRESGVESSETTESIIGIIKKELESDEMLKALEEEAKQKTRKSATENCGTKRSKKDSPTK
jgi:hypothetical protein